MKVLTLSNQKGGVAKTTTSIAIATCLFNKGFRVLAVDLDPQTNMTFACGVDTMNQDTTLFDVFKKDGNVKDIIIQTNVGFGLIPGCLSLASADMDFTQTGREYMLNEALKEIESEYDYCIIDTPPTLGILTVNALTCSDLVVVPMCADVYSVQGLSQLNQQIMNVQKYCNQRLKIGGLLLTKYNDRQNVSKTTREMIESVSDQLQTKVFNTTIRESVAVRESALMQNDLFKEAPNSNATVDYMEFVNEMIETGVL